MPDYVCQYPDYFSRVKQAKAGPFLPQRVARVRITAVRPNDRFLNWLIRHSDPEAELKSFYRKHIGYLPAYWRFGAWGSVRNE